MKLITAKFLIDENLEILENYGILMSDKIIKIDKISKLLKEKNYTTFIDYKNSVLAPAFVNTHAHLEFSANKTTLKYGDFIAWLGSVIKNSKKLSQKCTDKIMQKAINDMLKSGIATIGAISSFGRDTDILATSPLNVVHFNEILGSNEAMIEQNFNAFKERFSKSKLYQNERFTPAISLHSPYSIHPKLAKLALNFAKENNLIISTHFMESHHEKQWLESASGDFKKHLLNFTKDPKPNFSPDEYFKLFNNHNTLFTHCVYAQNFKDFKTHHSITHCPSSNRLLGKKALNLRQIQKHKINLSIGTDGLSSNLSLNMFDELRNAIFTHQQYKLNSLIKVLFRAATLGGANALKTNNGVLKQGKSADIMVLKALKCDNNDMLTQLILHTKNVKNLIIKGKICNL
ncbi:Aminodeoxyfutalosine deaminase [Campylobacter majalis]|uniref:Aminodeoxyfutalosine deaminase n=1 Tax=Campylobacter majalis TaxID=2790656 RepID=A0ABN7KAC1_9BACT|nr:aminofutalosine deaminase family hydrolase [Campylobacter majalis]CAD7287815.1 Aminodeoxyfutalosine deaminase [Campylobacter majalis]